MENINSFLGYFEILDPPMAETSWSLLSLFPFSSYFLLFFNLDFFLAIKTALHTTSATKKKTKQKKNAQERIVFHATDLGSSHTDGLLVSVK